MDSGQIIVIVLLIVLLIFLIHLHLEITSNPDVTVIHPKPVIVQPSMPIGGCAGTRYGCCPNGVTPKMDANGSNC